MPVLERESFEACGHPVACVVHHNIELPKGVERRLNGAFDILGFGCVHFAPNGGASLSLNDLYGSLRPARAEICDHDRCPFLRESTGRGQANARPCSCHDDAVFGKTLGHVVHFLQGFMSADTSRYQPCSGDCVMRFLGRSGPSFQTSYRRLLCSPPCSPAWEKKFNLRHGLWPPGTRSWRGSPGCLVCPDSPETVYTDPLVVDDVRHAQPGGLSDQALGPCGVSGAC